MPWLRGPDDAPEQHACPLPPLENLLLRDHGRIGRWRWICPECDRVYGPMENEALGDPYKWGRLMPWTEWYWRGKARDIVFRQEMEDPNWRIE